MVLTLTPYAKNGIGTVSTSGSSTTTTSDTARGFRNVAVGATITAGGLTRTVLSKTNEQTITVDSAWSMSSDDWTFLNQPLTINGLYSYRTDKFDSSKIIPIPYQDTGKTWVFPQGTVRETLLNCWFQSSDISDIIRDLTILESMVDGTQTKQGTVMMTEDVPPRTSYLWISSVDWIIKRDKPNWVMVLIAMVECKNRGSL